MERESKKLLFDSILKIFIALAVTIIPLVVSNQITTAQKLTEVIELYDLIDNERDINTKKVFIELWLKMSPGAEIEKSLEGLLVSIDTNIHELSENSARLVDSFNEFSEAYEDNTLNVESINNLNSNFANYFDLQLKFAKGIGTVPIDPGQRIIAPQYITDDEKTELDKYFRNINSADIESIRNRVPHIFPKSIEPSEQP